MKEVQRVLEFTTTPLKFVMKYNTQSHAHSRILGEGEELLPLALIGTGDTQICLNTLGSESYAAAL